MKYLTVYTTSDKNEVSVLKNLFEEEKIDFQIIPDGNAAGGGLKVPEKRIRVAQKDREKARELVDQTGFLRVGDSAVSPTSFRQRWTGQKWLFFFLAALIIVLAAIFLIWFMNLEGESGRVSKMGSISGISWEVQNITEIFNYSI